GQAGTDHGDGGDALADAGGVVRLLGAGVLLRVVAAFADQHERRVRRDAVHPRREARLALEAGDVAPAGDQRVLQGVLGILAVRGDGQADGPDLVAMRFHELTESRRVTVTCAAGKVE